MADGSVVIEIQTDGKPAEKSVQGIKGAFEGLGDHAKTTTSRVKDMIQAFGLVKLAQAGFNLLKNSMDGAIKRFDTLNNANKVFENMGFGAEETARMMDSLTASLDGLPTAADDAVQNIMRISMANNDIEKAGKLFEYLNYAVLAADGSAEDVNSTIEMFSRSLQRGTMNGHEWEAMMRNMGPTMNNMADLMGISINDLQKGLSDGTISFEEFEKALHELAVNGNGDFADLETQARDMTAGIGTAMTNFKSRVAEGIRGGIIEPLDNALAHNGFPRIAEMIDIASSSIRDNLREVGGMFDPLIEKTTEFFSGFSELDMSGLQALSDNFLPALQNGFQVMYDIAKPTFDELIEAFGVLWEKSQPLISAIAEMLYPAFEILGSFIGGFFKGVMLKIIGAFEVLGFIIEFLTPVFQMLVGVFEKASPILSKLAEWVGVVIGVFADFGSAGEGLKGILKSAWENISNAVSTAKDIIKGAIDILKNAFNILKNAGTALQNGLSGAWQLIQTAISGAGNVINSVISGIKSFFTSLGSGGTSLRSVLTGAWNGIVSVVSGASSRISGFINTIKRLFTSLGNINLLGAGKAIINGFVKGLKSAWEAGKKFVSGIGDWIKKNKGPISYDRKLLVDAGDAIIGGLNKGLQASFPDVQNTVKGIAKDIDAEFKASYNLTNGPINQRLDTPNINNYIPTLSTASGALTNNTTINKSRNYDDSAIIELLKKIANKDPNTYIDGKELVSHTKSRYNQAFGEDYDLGRRGVTT